MNEVLDTPIGNVSQTSGRLCKSLNLSPANQAQLGGDKLSATGGSSGSFSFLRCHELGPELKSPAGSGFDLNVNCEYRTKRLVQNFMDLRGTCAGLWDVDDNFYTHKAETWFLTDSQTPQQL